MLWDAHQLMQKRYFKLRHDFFNQKTYVRMREVLVAVELSCFDVLDLLQLSYLYLSEPLRVGDRIVVLAPCI